MDIDDTSEVRQHHLQSKIIMKAHLKANMPEIQIATAWRKRYFAILMQDFEVPPPFGDCRIRSH